MFSGSNYAFWKIRMGTYLISLGEEVLAIVEIEYKFFDAIPTNVVEREVYTFNGQAKHAIFSGLA